MKIKYLAPESEPVQLLACFSLLQDSSLVDDYTGEDGIPSDGTW